MSFYHIALKSSRVSGFSPVDVLADFDSVLGTLEIASPSSSILVRSSRVMAALRSLREEVRDLGAVLTALADTSGVELADVELVEIFSSSGAVD